MRKPLDNEKLHDRLLNWTHIPMAHFMKTSDASNAVNHAALGSKSR